MYAPRAHKSQTVSSPIVQAPFAFTDELSRRISSAQPLRVFALEQGPRYP